METNKLIIALIRDIYVMEANRCYLHLEELMYKMLCQGPGRFLLAEAGSGGSGRCRRSVGLDGTSEK